MIRDRPGRPAARSGSTGSRACSVVAALAVLWLFGAVATVLVLVQRAASQRRLAAALSEARGHVALLAEQLNRAAAARAALQQRSDNDLPLVIYAFNRPQHLRELLDSLRAADGAANLTLVISLDGPASQRMFDVVAEASFARLVVPLVHPRWEAARGDDSEGQDHGGAKSGSNIDDPTMADGVLRIKRHWLWLLRAVFAEGGVFGAAPPRAALFIEEDCVVSRDALTVATALNDMLRLRYAQLCPNASCWGFSLYTPAHLQQPERGVAAAIRVGLPSSSFAPTREFALEVLRFEGAVLRCQDGWDVAVRTLQATGWLPQRYLAPLRSRVKNLGRSGVNVRGLRYETLRLGAVELGGGDPLSTPAALEFVTDVGSARALSVEGNCVLDLAPAIRETRSVLHDK